MTTLLGRKVRANAKLARLDAAQRDRLHAWFEENLTYAEVVKRLRHEFGVSVGKSTVGAYWRRHILPEQQQDDTEVAALFAAIPAGDFAAATLQRARALAFEALARPDPDVDLAAKLLAIVGKAERHALAVEKLALEERKVVVREKLAARRLAALAKKHSVAQCEPRPATSVPSDVRAVAPVAREVCAAQDLPRFPSYSNVIPLHAAGASPANYANAQAELGTTEDAKGRERGGESAEVAGCDESTEVAAETRRSEEPEDEGANFPAAEPMRVSPAHGFDVPWRNAA